MDLYCPTCKEPWDNDSLHEEADARGVTYSEVSANFRKKGCKALETAFGPQASCVADNSPTTTVLGELYDLMGDDMDGAASLIDDARSMGLLGDI